MKYKISELAKLLDVSTNTVRRYEHFGHIESVREEKNGYRFYGKKDITQLMIVRKLRKYGFSHHDIMNMREYDIDALIHIYQNHIMKMGEDIAYHISLKERLQDDLILLKKVVSNKENKYLRQCIEYSYIIYQSDDMLLKEEERLKKVHQFLNISPKVQMIYLIRKEDILFKRFIVNIGWAMKVNDLKENHVEENDYTERFPSRTTFISIVKVPNVVKGINEIKSKVMFEHLLQDTFQTMKEKNYILDGDILGIIVATVYENHEEIEYVLMNIPIIVL